MTGLVAHLPVIGPVTALVLGVLLGLVHFRSLRWTTDSFAEGKALRALLLQLARMALMTVALVIVARSGALPLLAAALGVLLGRALVLRRERRA